jgi:uncharacterized membrane-anchored protein
MRSSIVFMVAASAAISSSAAGTGSRACRNLGAPLEVTTVVFAVLLAAAFTAWYRVEGTLSIHTIDTPRQETFYWLAILVTFALGTAAGDLAAEAPGLGYLAWPLGAASELARRLCWAGMAGSAIYLA